MAVAPSLRGIARAEQVASLMFMAKSRKNAAELSGEKSGGGTISVVKRGSPCRMDTGEVIIVDGIIPEGKKLFYRAQMARDADVRVLVPINKVRECEGTERENFTPDTGKYENE